MQGQQWQYGYGDQLQNQPGSYQQQQQQQQQQQPQQYPQHPQYGMQQYAQVGAYGDLPSGWAQTSISSYAPQYAGPQAVQQSYMLVSAGAVSAQYHPPRLPPQHLPAPQSSWPRGPPPAWITRQGHQQHPQQPSRPSRAPERMYSGSSMSARASSVPSSNGAAGLAVSDRLPAAIGSSAKDILADAQAAPRRILKLQDPTAAAFAKAARVADKAASAAAQQPTREAKIEEVATDELAGAVGPTPGANNTDSSIEDTAAVAAAVAQIFKAHRREGATSPPAPGATSPAVAASAPAVVGGMSGGHPVRTGLTMSAAPFMPGGPHASMAAIPARCLPES